MDCLTATIEKFQDKKIPYYERVNLSSESVTKKLIDDLEAGQYKFATPKAVFVPKGNGKLRRLLVLPVRDRFLMSYYTEKFTVLCREKIHPQCVSYRKGTSVPKIIRKLQTELRDCAPHGYKVDLSKYFDSVPVKFINECLDSLDNGDKGLACIREFYNTNLVKYRDGVHEEFKSLSQGCAFSSLLANLILRDVDEAMSSYCDVYYRYSDDIIFFAENPNDVLQYLSELLSKCGLSINAEKTEALSVNQPFTFLGTLVCGSESSIGVKQRNAIKAEIKKRVAKTRSVYSAVHSIQSYLFGSMHPYFAYICELCTDDSYIRLLDKFCMHTIQAKFAGCHNSTKCNRALPPERIYDAGWVSLAYVYAMYKSNTRLGHEYMSYLSYSLLKTVDIEKTVSYEETIHAIYAGECVRVNPRARVVSINGKKYSVDVLYRLTKANRELVADHYNRTIGKYGKLSTMMLSEVPVELAEDYLQYETLMCFVNTDKKYSEICDGCYVFKFERSLEV